MFLNPFGYDVAFAYTMSLFGGSFVKADIAFYIIASMFFTIFFIASKTNPICVIGDWIRNLKTKIQGLKLV